MDISFDIIDRAVFVGLISLAVMLCLGFIAAWWSVRREKMQSQAKSRAADDAPSRE